MTFPYDADYEFRLSGKELFSNKVFTGELPNGEKVYVVRESAISDLRLEDGKVVFTVAFSPLKISID